MFEAKRVNYLSAKITTLTSSSLKNLRQQHFKEIYFEAPEETRLLVSMALNIYEPLGVRTKHNHLKSSENYQDILGNIWYYYSMDDYSSIVKATQQHSIQWQNIIRAVLSKQIITAVGEDFVLTLLGNYYSRAELLHYISLPEILEDEDLVVQSISRNSGEIIFPVYGFVLNKNMNINRLHYLMNYGGRLVSSNKSQRVRREISETLGFGRYGVLFYSQRMKGYKHRQSFNILTTQPIEVTSKLLKAKLVNFEDISPYMPHIVINNKEELFDWVKANHKRSLVVLGSGGIVKLEPTIEYKNVRIVDYITNEDYEAIGVLGEYEGTKYPFYFDVSKTELIHGIQGRYLKVMIKKIQGEVMSISFNSVSKAWSSEYSECRACGSTETKHYKDGMCSSCIYKIHKNISLSNFNNLEGLNDFAIHLPHKYDEQDTVIYYIEHVNNKTSYEPIQGQLRFQF